MQSPTGCAKQLISVAWMSVPAALVMRPAPIAPACRFCRNRPSLLARLGLLDRGQRPATRAYRSLDARLVALEGVLLVQHVPGWLRGQCVGRELQVVAFHDDPLLVMFWPLGRSRGDSRQKPPVPGLGVGIASV